MKRITHSLNVLLILLTGSVLLSGCSNDPRSTGIEYAPQMYHSIPLEPFTQVAGKKALFADGRNQQIPPEGSIPVDGWGAFAYKNTEADKERASVDLKSPFPVTDASIGKGKILFDRFCVACHGKSGTGDGKVPKLSENYPPPPSYADKDAKEISAGRIFHIITYGQNSMGSYASQLNPDERWSVIQYVQTLQKGYVDPSKVVSVKDSTVIVDGANPVVDNNNQ